LVTGLTATEVLDVARRYRNKLKGHGGYMKPSDASRLDNELQQSIRDFMKLRLRYFDGFSCQRRQGRGDR
jgi:hypothetical protein